MRLSVLLLLVGFHSSADAAVLCANASGSVFVRADACKANETTLDPAALGLTGPAGPPGADGADGVSGYEIVAQNFNVAASSNTTLTANCPIGKKVVGGGADSSPQFAPSMDIHASAPQSDGNAWIVRVTNTLSSLALPVLYYAICVTVIEPTA